MTDFASAFGLAFELIAGADSDLWPIVWLSLKVGLASTFFACAFGLPLGAWLCFSRSLGAVGIWWGLVAGLVAVAALLGWRVHVIIGGELKRL